MLHLRSFLVVFALLSAASPAKAVDCAKASTAIEHAICGDPALKARDAAVSQAYLASLHELKGELHDLLIADQRRWLEEGRGTDCDRDATPAALVPCLTTNLTARQRAIAICFADHGDLAPEATGAPVTGTDLCAVHIHRTCPKVIATASARLVLYPWLLDKVRADAKVLSSGDCGPKSAEAAGMADKNEAQSSATILTERPNLVSVRYENDLMYRGAAHPSHDERIVSYDTRTKAEIPVAALLPTLKTGSALLAKISREANKALSVPCCGDDAGSSFSSIFLPDESIPDGWAVSATGDLILAYDYNTLGREFVATTVIPRQLFIDAVDPKYAAIFVKDPTGN